MNQKQQCRVCTKDLKDHDSPNLFERSHKKLLRQIQELTGLKLRKSKELPQQICRACQTELENAHRFRVVCVQSQEYFKTPEYRQMNLFHCHARTPSPIIVQTAPESIVKEEEPFDTEYLLKNEPEILENLSELARNSDVLCDDEMHDRSYTMPTIKKKTLLSKRHKPRKKRTEDDKQSDFICDQCGNHFSCKHHLITHLRRHTGEKPFECELCPDKFFTHSELNRHMRKHTGERPFGCQHCGRHFTDYSTRLKHERTHTNTRPFVCSQCGKAFTTSYILKNHMLIHTGERSFRCGLCNKSFQRQTHLVVHYRSLAHKQNEKIQKQPEGTELMCAQ